MHAYTPSDFPINNHNKQILCYNFIFLPVIIPEACVSFPCVFIRVQNPLASSIFLLEKCTYSSISISICIYCNNIYLTFYFVIYFTNSCCYVIYFCDGAVGNMFAGKWMFIYIEILVGILRKVRRIFGSFEFTLCM